MYRQLLVFICLISSHSVGANVKPGFPFVSAEGYAEMEVKPDFAIVSISLKTFNKSSTNALEKMSLVSEQLIKILQENDSDIESIEATDLDKNTIRTRNDNYQNLDIQGYEFSRTFNFEITEVSAYSRIMEKVLALDNVSNAYANFDAANRESLEQDLKVEAGKKARENAMVLVKGLNAKIASVYAITQGRGDYGDYSSAFAVPRDRVMMRQRSPSRPQLTLYSPKHITISQTVSAMFKILPQ
ncbi:MAG: SIMPL domain-containing protein [Kangiellaceae bacterium]|nr:SIMPL domain-containing protein [Kangiellaceae bacterium]MCW8997966.1 SIMPL domain-containing protein [Kangiellaceae bacterium]MCW9017787.1 SIMPL domain-containing protein [Kangiellaceae bacterium]